MTKPFHLLVLLLGLVLLATLPAVAAGIPDEEVDDQYPEYAESDDGGDFPYYTEEFGNVGGLGPWQEVLAGMHEHGLDAGDFVVSDFVVGGVNLASFEMDHPAFALYEDFDISEQLQSKPDWSWKELLRIRRNLQRPSLSYYVDKVARKRHFAEISRHGNDDDDDDRLLDQPKILALHYRDELSTTGRKSDERQAIRALLPDDRGFCAKPTHMSLSAGNWLVDIDHADQNKARFSQQATRLQSRNAGGAKYHPVHCADSLAEGLHRGPDPIESWALKNVQPGIVIEELWADHEDPRNPPQEFNVFVVWGRVYLAQWNVVGGKDGDERLFSGMHDRAGHNRCLTPDGANDELPGWVPWDDLVSLAERLGRHKDMLRVDVFVGLPKTEAAKSGTTPQPRMVVSESELHPTTVFCNPLLAEELARLWVAGYRIGNYRLIPNDEVPRGYVADQRRRKRTSMLRETSQQHNVRSGGKTRTGETRSSSSQTSHTTTTSASRDGILPPAAKPRPVMGPVKATRRKGPKEASPNLSHEHSAQAFA